MLPAPNAFALEGKRIRRMIKMTNAGGKEDPAVRDMVTYTLRRVSDAVRGSRVSRCFIHYSRQQRVSCFAEHSIGMSQAFINPDPDERSLSQG